MKIGVVTSDYSRTIRDRDDPDRPLLGGAGWARIGSPAKYLSRHGIGKVEYLAQALALRSGEMVGHPWRDGHPDLDEIVGGFDVLVIQRMTTRGFDQGIRAARAFGQRVVSDLDDHYWALDRRNDASRGMSEKVQAQLAANLDASDLVITSTPYLAEVLSERVNAQIEVIENSVDLELFPAPHSGTQHELAGWRPDYGWVGATPWRSGDLEILRRPIQEMLRHEDGYCRLVHMGAMNDDEDLRDVLGLPKWSTARPDRDRTHVPYESGPMFPIWEIAAAYSAMDVGLVPLNAIPFNRAKSAIKGLEYAAAGVPFIASDIDAYRAVSDRLRFSLCTKPKHWVAAARALRDPDRRIEEAAANRVAVEDFFDMGRNWVQFAEAWLA
jgi:glycosyltransferase involved in cell wall biosynthesis